MRVGAGVLMRGASARLLPAAMARPPRPALSSMHPPGTCWACKQRAAAAVRLLCKLNTIDVTMR